MSKKIQLFYDVLSPYSWIGFEILCRYRSCWNIELEFCPFSLPDVMKESQNRPPASMSAKAVYYGLDLQRLAKFYQIPLQLPSNVSAVMKKGTSRARLLLTVAKTLFPDRLEELSRQLWMRMWSRDEDITEDQSLCEAGLKAGLSQADLDKMLEMMGTGEVEEKLKKSTQEALDLGCFGAPFIVAHVEDGRKEPFFGSDRMELMASIIGEKWHGPLVEVKQIE